MKTLRLLILAPLCALLATAADAPTRTVLLTSTLNGVTTTLYVGDVNGTQSASGTLTLQIVPLVEKKDSAGNVIVSALDTTQALTITLTPEQYGPLSALVKAAFEARAAAANP